MYISERKIAMSENEPSRKSVNIPLESLADAAPYMTRQNYKFQGLLLELFESWLDQQKSGSVKPSAKPTVVRREGDEYHELLDRVLSSSDDEGKAAVKAIIAAFANKPKGRKPHGLPAKKTDTRTINSSKASG